MHCSRNGGKPSTSKVGCLPPPNSEADTALWKKFNSLCRSRGWNEISMAREFSQIKAAALQKLSAQPEIERATDGVSASDAVGVSSGKGLYKSPMLGGRDLGSRIVSW